RGRTPHFAVEAEHRDAVARIGLVRGLDHIVLLVALEPVLGAESAGHIDASGDQRIEAVRQVLRDRCRMRDEGDTPPIERRPEVGFGEQPVYAEFHAGAGAASLAAKQASLWKS